MPDIDNDTGADIFEDNEELLTGSDMLPNEGGSAVFGDTEDEELDEDEQALQKEVQDERYLMRSSSAPLLEALDTWFDNEIAATDSIKAAREIAKEYGTDLESAMMAADVVAGLLKSKKDNIQTLKEIHRPEIS